MKNKNIKRKAFLTENRPHFYYPSSHILLTFLLQYYAWYILISVAFFTQATRARIFPRSCGSPFPVYRRHCARHPSVRWHSSSTREHIKDSKHPVATRASSRPQTLSCRSIQSRCFSCSEFFGEALIRLPKRQSENSPPNEFPPETEKIPP